MKKLNKKGFTLVELLAVIVVLALLMVIATSTIGSALDNSRKKALTIAAQKFLNDAYTTAQSELLNGSQATTSVSINKDGYSGSITIDATTGKITSYCVSVTQYNIKVNGTHTGDGVPTVGASATGTCA